MKIKEKLAKIFVKLANKLTKEETYVSNMSFKNFLDNNIPIVKYDIDRFEYVYARHEMQTEYLERIKKSGIHIDENIKDLLANELGKEIIKRHKDDIRSYQSYNGNVLSGKTVFELKLLVEKPMDNKSKNI